MPEKRKVCRSCANAQHRKKSGEVGPCDEDSCQCPLCHPAETEPEA